MSPDDYFSRSIVMSNVSLGPRTKIEPMSIIGKPNDEHMNAENFEILRKTIIGQDCVIKAFSTIFEGATLEDSVVCGEYSLIGSGTIVGSRTRVQYGAQIFRNVRIGPDCRIGGFLCAGTTVGANSNVYGACVHVFRRRGESCREPGTGPTIGVGCTIGFHATVVGAITVGDGSYVAAGAVVTKNVPPKSKVVGVNVITPR
jgi:acetyltransferase-like isoleucine patch superfamily enzyme